jgi:uncharacterized protein (TIGR03435 family)
MVLAYVAIFAATITPAIGQVDPASSVVDPEAHGLPAKPLAAPAIAFEVVSIKRRTIPSDQSSIESRPESDGITIRNLALKWIIDFAYDFPRPDLVSGLPDWASSDNYDIMEKIGQEDIPAFQKMSQAERRLLVQAMLADRFKLKVHSDAKEIPVYALVVAKNGPKMKQAVAGDTYANGLKSPNGNPVGPGTLTPTGMGQITAQAAQMSALATMLSRFGLGRELVDKTGLTGRYDFTLRFAPTDNTRPVINGQRQAASDEEMGAASVFTAFQEQLGLKLEATKAMVEGLAVDHVERPSEN